MMLASVGLGDYGTIAEAIEQNCKKNLAALPDESLGDRLRERFEIYKSIYPALKEQFLKL